MRGMMARCPEPFARLVLVLLVVSVCRAWGEGVDPSTVPTVVLRNAAVPVRCLGSGQSDSGCVWNGAFELIVSSWPLCCRVSGCRSWAWERGAMARAFATSGPTRQQW